VRKRLITYAALAEPLIALYRSRHGFITVNGAQPPERVTDDLFKGLDSLG
jgi:adenylate kinase family enzyme